MNTKHIIARIMCFTCDEQHTEWTQIDDSHYRCQRCSRLVTHKDTCPPALRRKLLKQYEGRCARCGVPEWQLSRRLHIHRTVPGRSGGTYTESNCIPVCAACHRAIEGKS